MAFTRFNYDKCRTEKNLQQATGPGRYILNVPGNAGDKPAVFNDPQIRMQKWGGNLQGVYNGHPIDIESDLKNVGRRLSKFCNENKFPNKKVKTFTKRYPVNNTPLTDQTRTTHPAWLYRDLEQNHMYPLLLDPQENVCKHFHNNINTRLLERDTYVPEYPCTMLMQ
jgi:hypothetical protein|tara:strand:+ start:653 stop:1153 length:501 start_codon:yes stop_codon:yes gene_type:complete